MSLRINLNTAGLSAWRNLGASDSALTKSIEKLSSGYRINSAGDDPAGLVISEKLRAQVSGIGMAVKNAGDAVNMVKTAEGALQEVSRLLSSMRDLAVHASNIGANDTATAAADQQQIQNAIQSINKIAAETQFGNKKLLDGTAGITASIAGADVIAGDFSNTVLALEDGDQISVNVTAAAEQATIASADLGEDTDNLASDGTFYMNGVAINYTTSDTVAGLAEKVNAVSDQTGVTAATDGAGVINFTSVAYGSAASITATEAVATIFGATSTSDTGVDAAATITSGGENVSDASWTAGAGNILKDSRGNSIVLKEGTTGNVGVEFTITAGTLKFQVGAFSGQTRSVNLNSAYADKLGTTAVAGEDVSTIDVTTFDGAQDAIDILEQAISDVSTMRANLGATQKNVLESSINSLNVAKENISASESAIRDTDMAAEMVEFTKNQILQQAGVAMLAQANQAPQALLSLLQ